MGGLGIPIFAEIADREFQNSVRLTERLSGNIRQQNRQYNMEHEQQARIKNKMKSEKRKMEKETLEHIKDQLSSTQVKLVELNNEKGASIYLSTLPLKDEGYLLPKNIFWDLVRLRYDWPLARLPERCGCGSKFDIQHAFSCKKGGFVSLRHNHLRNVTSSLLQEVCKDVSIEPTLQPLTGERFETESTITGDEARVDIKARGFWQAGQLAFFDVRVFNPIANRYANQGLSKMYETNEKEKKRTYNERILQIEHGRFTPLVFSATGGMGREAMKFYSRLAEMIAEKRRTDYSKVITWIRRKVCFSLINSLGLCLRGSRSITNNELVNSVTADNVTSEMLSPIHEE